MSKKSVCALLGVAALGLGVALVGTALGGRASGSVSLPGFIGQLFRGYHASASASASMVAVEESAEEAASAAAGAAETAEAGETGEAAESRPASQEAAKSYDVYVELGAATVNIAMGDEFRVDAHGHEDALYSAGDGAAYTVTAAQEGDGAVRWDGITVDITLPRGRMDHVELIIGAGKLNAEGLACRSARLEVGAGQMTLSECTVSEILEAEAAAGQLQLSGSVSGTALLSVGAGQMVLDVDRPADYGYQVACSMGSVIVGEDRFSGLDTTGARNESADTLFAVQCDLGSVEVNFR